MLSLLPSPTTFARTLLAVGMLSLTAEAARSAKFENPDFLAGDPIPEGATHDWNLGATGARGWIYSEKLTTLKARQIKITKIAERSPADRHLEVGDVIIGVDGKPFSYDAREEFARALTAAEEKVNQGRLKLTRWRDGKTDEVTLELPVLGTYSETAPYDCPKSAQILELGAEALAEKMSGKNYRENPITRSLNALALLATGEEKYLSLIEREVEWAEQYAVDRFATWYYGYVMIFLAEYHLFTGTEPSADGLQRIAQESSTGQSIVGSWGHRFAGDDGRLVGYGMMNAPGLTLTIGLVLAREAGAKSPELDLAIERSLNMMRFYAGKGSIPYGDHKPWIQTHDDNGKNGMGAVLFSLAEEPAEASYFARMSLASHGNERDMGHTGNFWNMTWALPSVAQSGPEATGAWMHEFGTWYYDLARNHEGLFPHQGPPQPNPDSTRNWDASGAYLLAYAMPRKHLYITGKKPSAAPELDKAQVASIVGDGRGWNNLVRNTAHENLNIELLFERLGSWSPVVRNRSAMALAKRKEEVPVDALIKMLNSSDLLSNYGAAEALENLGSHAIDAVPDLVKALDHEDLWLRIKAAEALANMGGAATNTLPILLKRLTRGQTPEDPRGMEQRYLMFAVFGEMLKNSLDDVDKELLQEAIVASLQNQDGRARGAVSNIYSKLSYDEIKPLLPAIHQAIVNPAPSGIMFADGVRQAGLHLLAKHRIEDGIPLSIQLMDLDRWGKVNRIRSGISVIEKYGFAAKSFLPQLIEFQNDLKPHSKRKEIGEQYERLSKFIKKLEDSGLGDSYEPLRKL